jgi:hypothetical protein
MDGPGFEERGEGAGRRVRVRAERGDQVLSKPSTPYSARTLTLAPLPEGRGSRLEGSGNNTNGRAIFRP